MESRIVKLNIGGHKYCTTNATLTKYPDTFFTSLLSDALPTTKDENGSYFIDRDGQFFSPILTYLRTNEISIPNTMTKEDVIREARFYSIEPLVYILTHNNEEENENTAIVECPQELGRYVIDYWARHESTIMKILNDLNKEGHIHVSAKVIPGHRQDFERPPKLLDDGKLGLYMNFTCLHISRYTRVQCLLANCFKNKGFSGYFRASNGELIELWWSNNASIKRESDIFYF